MKLKFTVIFILFLITISSFSCVHAASLSEMVGQVQDFMNAGSSNVPDVGDAADEIFDIGSILTSIGVVVMLGATAYMGIKYLTASPETKGKLKVQLIGLVVSGMVIFGAYYIWKIVIDIASKF